MGLDPAEDGLDGVLVAALEGVAEGAAVAQGGQQGQHGERRVVLGGGVEGAVEGLAEPAPSQVALPGGLAARARQVVGDDDVGALADEVETPRRRGPALPLPPRLVVRIDRPRH